MPLQTFDQILEGRLSQSHQLIEVLQDIQESHGYVSEDAMRAVSQGLGVPLIEVYSVASFYKAFRLRPSGKHILTICMGTACHVRGAGMLLDQAVSQLGIEPGEVTPDGLFSIECVNCLGACALGPVVTENGNYHHHMTPAKLRKLIETLSLQEEREEPEEGEKIDVQA